MLHQVYFEGTEKERMENLDGIRIVWVICRLEPEDYYYEMVSSNSNSTMIPSMPIIYAE